MKRLSLVLMALLVAVVVAAPVQAVQLDSMDNIAARPWTDYRGAGWLHQNNTIYSEGTGSMGIDYGVTGYPDPDPDSGWDYYGSWVGVGGPGGAFDVNGNYKGSWDREIVGDFVLGYGPGEMPLLDTGLAFRFDVYEEVLGGSEHIRELQIYDSSGFRNTYSVTAEGDAGVDVGWNTHTIFLTDYIENAANLMDIVQIRFFLSTWAFIEDPPEVWTRIPPTGSMIKIDDLRLIPEPATIAMLSLGGLALLRRRKA